MSAFAAILSCNGDDAGTEAVAAVLTACTGRVAHAFSSHPCTLLLAPLHTWDPVAPVVSRDGAVAAAGQVMLEDSDDLRRALHLMTDAPELEILASAFERWGASTRRMQGEYAFAAWHAQERTLTCARDGLGIRVLYVGHSSRAIVVSNVLDAVIAHPAIPTALNDAALIRFLAHGTMTTTGATPYTAVRMVPPGHTLRLNAQGGATLQRHWEPPPLRAVTSTDERSIVDGYREVLRRSVGDRIARRRCTLFLSGGIDSTTLAATAVECSAAVRAVTFRYGRIDMDEEVALATSVAQALAIPIDEIGADTDEALEAQRRGRGPATLVDEPALSNWRAGLAQAAQFSTLAIYGEDGDALFAPPGGAALLARQSLPSILAATARLVASDGEVPYVGLHLRQRLGLWNAPSPLAPAWLTPAARRVLDGPEDEAVLGLRPQPIEGSGVNGRTWLRLLKNVPFDFAVSLSPDVTRQRLAMTLPLMDSRVIGYVQSVPPIPWCHRKRLARAAFSGRLPASVLERPKTPVPGGGEAMVRAWRQHGGSNVAASQAAATGWIDAHLLNDALDRGSADAAMAAWRALMLDAWLERRVTEGAPCIR